MMNKFKSIVFVFLIFASCFNDSDLEIDTDKTITSTFGVPLTHGSFKLKSILPDPDENLKIGENGIYSISAGNLDPVKVNYKNSIDIFGQISTTAPSVNVAIPNFPGNTANIDIPIEVEKDVSIAPGAGKVATIDSAKFSAGQIAIKITIPADSYQLDVIFINDTVKFSNGDLTDTKTINLKDKILDFNKVKFVVDGKINNGANLTGDAIVVDFTFSSTEFQTIWGDFSKIDIPAGELAGQEYDIETPDFDDYEDIFDKVYVNDLSIGMGYKTTLGVEANIILAITQQLKNSNSWSDLTKDTLSIRKSPSAGTEISDKDSVKIQRIGLDIQKIKFDDVDINLGQNANDFITFPLNIELTPKLEIPLNVTMNHIDYSFYTELGDLDEGSQIDRAKLQFSYKNTLPLNIGLKAYLIKDGKRKDSVDVTDEKNQNSPFLQYTEEFKNVYVNMENKFANQITSADSMED
jgi:hypothetical protein